MPGCSELIPLKRKDKFFSHKTPQTIYPQNCVTSLNIHLTSPSQHVYYEALFSFQ